MDPQAGDGKLGLIFWSGIFPVRFTPVLSVLILDVAADVAGSRWLILCGFPNSCLKEGPLRLRCLIVACVVMIQFPDSNPPDCVLKFHFSATSAHNSSHTS